MPYLRVLLFAGLLTVLALPANAQLGVSAGANFDRLNDIELERGEAAFDNRTGWHVEVWYELSLGPIGLQPGVRYMDAGQLYDGLRDEDGVERSDVSVNMIEVPINLRYRFGAAPLIKPYLSAGPVFRFPFADDDGLNDDLETISVAAGVGFGVEAQLAGFRLYPEIAYTFGLSRFAGDEFTIGGRDFIADEAQYLNAVMLRIGIGL